MKRATITEAKNGLSALIDRVRGGETVVITDRGTPVARLEPMTSSPDADGRLERLERAGVIRRGTAPVSLQRLLPPPPKLPDGTSAVGTLLDERRAGW